MSVRLMLVRQLESSVRKRVADRMPEIENAMRAAAHEARAKDYIGFALQRAARARADIRPDRIRDRHPE